MITSVIVIVKLVCGYYDAINFKSLSGIICGVHELNQVLDLIAIQLLLHRMHR